MTLRALSEVRPVAHASRKWKSFVEGGAGERGNERTLKETVSERKAARKRVTSVEPRDAGKWKEEEQNNERQTNASAPHGYAVAGAEPSAIDSERTERLADLLVRGSHCPHLAEKPLTGKPYFIETDTHAPAIHFDGAWGRSPPCRFTESPTRCRARARCLPHAAPQSENCWFAAAPRKLVAETADTAII